MGRGFVKWWLGALFFALYFAAVALAVLAGAWLLVSFVEWSWADFGGRAFRGMAGFGFVMGIAFWWCIND